jgi:hypothetical protein
MKKARRMCGLLLATVKTMLLSPCGVHPTIKISLPISKRQSNKNGKELGSENPMMLLITWPTTAAASVCPRGNFLFGKERTRHMKQANGTMDMKHTNGPV